VAYTLGFNSARVLALKFAKHGQLLGAKTEAEYLSMADAFVGGPKTPETLECARHSDLCLLRFHEGRQDFGVMFTDGVIATFYRFDPPPRNARWFSKQCAG